MSKPEYVPRGYSQTNDCFASVIIWAPDFKNSGMTTREGFQRLLNALDTVIGSANHRLETAALLIQCKEEVVAVREMFLANTTGNKDERQAANRRLQCAYQELFKRAGQLLKPGAEIGPDDEI